MVSLLILDKLGIFLEDIEAFLDIELIIETDAVCDLVIFLDQVERFWDSWVVFEAITAHL